MEHSPKPDSDDEEQLIEQLAKIRSETEDSSYSPPSAEHEELRYEDEDVEPYVRNEIQRKRDNNNEEVIVGNGKETKIKRPRIDYKENNKEMDGPAARTRSRGTTIANVTLKT